MNTFAERFSSLLVDRGWNAEEAARNLPVSAVAIRGWMGAPGTKPVTDPRASHVLAICDEFQVRPEWLVRGDLPRERAMSDWPFITPRARIESLPVLFRSLLDRIIFDFVEMLDPAKSP
jgi:hypothetical protein